MSCIDIHNRSLVCNKNRDVATGKDCIQRGDSNRSYIAKRGSDGSNMRNSGLDIRILDPLAI